MADVVGTGLPFWTDDDGDWDTLILGGTVWPGIWELSGDGVSRDIDVKKSKGSDTATLKDEGYQNAKFTATGTIWTAEQFSELQAILPEIHPRRKGGDRQALQIVHPAANLLGIDSVYLKGIKMPALDGPKGGPMTIVLDLIEWVPKPVVPKNTSGGCGKAYYDAQKGLAAAVALLASAKAMYDSDPTNAGYATAYTLAVQGKAFAAAEAATTPCSNSGNKAVADLNDEDLSGSADAGLGDDGEDPTGAADGLGDWE